MGVGFGGGESYEIRVTTSFVDQVTGPLAAAQRQVDSYTASLERLAAAQARAGFGGGVTAGGKSVATSTLSPAAGPPPVVLPSGPLAGGGFGGPGRSPTVAPGAVTVGGFVPPAATGAGRSPGVVPALVQQPGGGRPGSQPNAAAGGGGRPGSAQNTALRFVVGGVRDLEAASGALGGVLQSVTSLRALATGGGLAALVGIPMELANASERAQRAFAAVLGDANAGARLSQQLDAQLAQQPYDLAQVRSGAVTLSRVGGGRFASRAPNEIAAITQAGAAAGLGQQDVQQITSIFASAQSYQSRMRLTGEQVAQLADLLPAEVDPFQVIAQARNQAHPGEHWTAQSLRQYLTSGATLPGGETTNELSQALQRYADQHPGWRQAPDVLQGQARNRATQAGAQLGVGFQQALTPALTAAAQGDVGGTLAGLAPWTLAQGNVGAGLAIGAGEFVVGSSLIDTLIRAPYRAVRPIARLGRTVGVIPRGRTPGGITPGGPSGGAAVSAVVDPLTARAAAVGLSRPELSQVAKQLRATPEEALAIFERAPGRVTRGTAVAPAAERLPGAVEGITGGPGRPPNFPPAVTAEAGAVEGAAREVGFLGRAGGALGRVGGAVGRAAPLLGLGIGLLGAYEAAQQGQQEEAARQAGGAVGGFAGGWAGAAAGAAIGSAILPGIGTVAGGLIGGLGLGLGGGWLGEQLGGAVGSAMNWQDAQAANENALQTTQRGTTANRDLYDETVRLTSAFSDLEQIVRTLTQDYRNLRRVGGPGSPGGGPSFGGGGGPSLPLPSGNAIVPAPLPPGAVPQPGDIAGWRTWLQQSIPMDVQAANPSLVNDMLAGGYGESGLNPTKVQQGGGGRGLFQTDVIGGKGKGATAAQLFDPNWQLRTMLPAYIQAEQSAPAGLSPAERASWVDAHAERPLNYEDPNSIARRNYAAAFAQVQATPDMSSASGGGNTTIQTGDINLPVTVGGVPQDPTAQRAWARRVSGMLMEEIANGIDISSSASAPAAPQAPLAFGG